MVGHRPQPLRFNDTSNAPATESQHMPKALDFGGTPAPIDPKNSPASPVPSARPGTPVPLFAPGASPSVVPPAHAPAPAASTVRSPGALSFQNVHPPKAPEGNPQALGLAGPGLPTGLMAQCQAMATKYNLDVVAVGRQAAALWPLKADVVDHWAEPALTDHAEHTRKAMGLRDRILQAQIGEALDRIAALPQSGTANGKGGVLKTLWNDLTSSAPKPLSPDEQDERVETLKRLIKTCRMELDNLRPTGEAIKNRLMLATAGLDAVQAHAATVPTDVPAALKERLDMRGDLVARTYLQSELTFKTLTALGDSLTSWSDQAQSIQTLLIPARRLAN